MPNFLLELALEGPELDPAKLAEPLTVILRAGLATLRAAHPGDALVYPQQLRLLRLYRTLAASYPLADGPPTAEIRSLFARAPAEPLTAWHHCQVRAVATGERRPPRRDEWYLSGAIVEAYQAPHDLCEPYLIARLVRVDSLKFERLVSGLAAEA
jgi:hypothetical protein